MSLKNVHALSFDPIILLQEIFTKEIEMDFMHNNYLIIVKIVRINLTNRRVAMNMP